jgi:hypothetical protein
MGWIAFAFTRREVGGGAEAGEMKESSFDDGLGVVIGLYIIRRQLRGMRRWMLLAARLVLLLCSTVLVVIGQKNSYRCWKM